MRIELENYDDVMAFLGLADAQLLDQALRPRGYKVVPIDGSAAPAWVFDSEDVAAVKAEIEAGLREAGEAILAAPPAQAEAEAEAEDKPKRKRRTKAEIEADKAQAAVPEASPAPEPESEPEPEPEPSTVNTGNPFAPAGEEAAPSESGVETTEAPAFGNDELPAAARAKAGDYPSDRLAHMAECRNFIQLKGLEAYNALTATLGAGGNVIAFDDATISAHRALLALALAN